MTCIKCGKALHLRRAKSTGEHEVWECPASRCNYVERFPLWGPRIDKGCQAQADHQIFTDKGKRGHVWHWDGVPRKGKEAA